MEQKVKEAVEKHLRALQTQVHNTAIYPSYKGVDAYITIKALDGIIKSCIDNLRAGGNEE